MSIQAQFNNEALRMLNLEHIGNKQYALNRINRHVKSLNEMTDNEKNIFRKDILVCINFKDNEEKK